MHRPSAFATRFNSVRFAILVSCVGSLLVALLIPSSVLAATPAPGVLTRLVQSTYSTQIVASRTGITGILCALCAVTAPGNVVDSSPTTKGRLYLTVGVGATGTIAVEDTTNTYAAGHFAGFVLGSGGITDIQIINKMTIKTYNNGVLQESKSGSNILLNAALLQANSQTVVGFVSTKNFDEIDVSISSLASVLVDVDVYAAVVQSVPPAPTISSPVAGSNTNNATPTISGTAAAENTVVVREGATVYCTTSATTSGTWSCTPSTAFSQGAHTITATATNLAGMATSGGVSFTVDTTAPASPTITAPAASVRTNNVSPAVAGTAEPNSTVVIKEGGTTLCLTTADANGSWICTPNAALGEGDHTISATATDAAGNTSAASATRTFTIDTVAPVAPSFNSPAAGSNVNTAMPTINGTAEANSTIVVREGNTTVCSTTASVNGVWSCTPNAALAQGPHAFVATATDAANNTSQTSSNHSFSIDTVAPSAPTISSPTNNGVINTTTPSFAGTAEPNSHVTVAESSTTVCVTTASANGNWNCAPGVAFGTGPHSITAVARDAANNSTPTTITFVVDTTAVSTPSITVPAAQAWTNNAQPIISGMADAGTTVTVREGTTTLCITTATSNGAWQCTPASALGEGSHTVTATATNGVGTSSPASRTFMVDTVAPTSAPSITNPIEGTRNNTQAIAFNGTNAEAGSTVIVQENATSLCVATADSSGNWQCIASALVEGSHTATATVRDRAGNNGPASSPRAFSVDTVAPFAPIITRPTAGDTTNDQTPDITGTAEANSMVVVKEGAITLCTTTADSAGRWSCVPSTPLNAGPHAITATATDASGNTGSASLPRGFSIDTQAPVAPTASSPSAGATTSARPVFSGQAEPGSTVTVAENNTVLCTAIADVNGVWSCTPTTDLGAGEHTVVITAVDDAGNTSTPLSHTFTVAAPTVGTPVVLEPAEGATLQDTTPTFRGTADPASTVTVAKGSATLCTTSVSNSGNWNCTLANELGNGAHTVTVTARDELGNSSAPVSRSFTVAPALFVSVTSPTSGSMLTTPWPTMRGKATPNNVVTLTLDPDNSAATNNNVVYTTSADTQGDWSIDTSNTTPTQGKLPASGLAVGNWIGLRATVADQNGGTTASAPIAVRIMAVMYLPITQY